MTTLAERLQVRTRQLRRAKERLANLALTLDRIETPEYLSGQVSELVASVTRLQAQQQRRIEEARAEVKRLTAFVARLQAEHDDRFNFAARDLVEELAAELAALPPAQARLWLVGLLRRVDEQRSAGDGFDLVIEAVDRSLCDRMALGKWEGTMFHREYKPN